MAPFTRWFSSFLLVVSAGIVPASVARADEEPADCLPLDHPPNPELSYDHTKLAHLSSQVGSWGFDLPGSIYALAVAPDNSRILAGGASRTALLWHPKAGREMRETDVTERDVTAAAFSPDSRTGLIGLGLSGTEGYPVYAWDLITGNRVQVFNGHTWDVTSVAYSHDGQRILSSSRDGTVRIWDPKTGKELHSMEHPWQVLAAAFSPDDKLVLSASRDGQMFLWNADTGDQVRTFDGLKGPVRSIAFSPDGTRVIGVSDAGLVFVWETDTGKQSRMLGVALTPVNGVPARFGALAHAPDQTKVKPLPAHMALSGNGEHFGIALQDGTLLSWNLKTMALEDPVGAPPRTEWAGGRLVLSDDGRVAVEGFVDGRVRLRDLSEHHDIVTGRHVDGGLEKLTTSADAKRFFGLNATTHELTLLDADLNVIHSYDSDGEGRFEPSGKAGLVALTDERTGKSTLKVVDSAKGDPTRQLIDTVYLEAFGFTPDNRMALALFTTEPPNEAPKSIMVNWDVKTGRKVKETNVMHTGETIFTRDGRAALTSLAQGGIILWDIASGKVKRNIARTASSRQHLLAISPDGNLLATTGGDRLISLWSMQSGDLLRTLKGHRCIIRGAAFTPDSKRLVSIGGADEELRLWDDETAEQVDSVDLISHNDHPVSATFSTDGQSFLVGTSRGIIMKFDFDAAGATATSDEVPPPPPADHR